MRPIIYRQDLKRKAQKLRANMTKEERHLWYDFLKGYGISFYRQKPIGDFIVDFYCASAKLVVELDGGGHYEPEEQQYDERRTKFLNGLGITVLRFSNLDIGNNFRGVCMKIDEFVRTSSASHGSAPSLPKGTSFASPEKAYNLPSPLGKP